MDMLLWRFWLPAARKPCVDLTGLLNSRRAAVLIDCLTFFLLTCSPSGSRKSILLTNDPSLGCLTFPPRAHRETASSPSVPRLLPDSYLTRSLPAGAGRT